MSENEKQMPMFLLVDGQTLLNLNQVRVVDEIREGHCRLVFSETFSVTVTGKGADDLATQLMARAITVDGTLIMDIWKEKYDALNTP